MPQTFYTEEEYKELEAKNTALKETNELLEGLRPYWAKGYTSDSVAAQSCLGAMRQLHQLLGVNDQTAAVQRIKKLLQNDTI